MRNILFLSFITIVVSGCATGSIGSSFQQKDGGESVLVFRVNPVDKNVFFYRGKEEEGVFKQNTVSRPVFSGKSKNGYVVFKASPGDTIALTQYTHKSFGFKNTAWPCEDFETISFTVPAGEVLYMTDMTLSNKGEAFNLNLTQNIDQARAHLQKYHRNIASNLKQGEFKMLKGDRACDESAVIPDPVAESSVSTTQAVPTRVDTSTSEVPRAAANNPIAETQMQIVEQYVAAFNARDINSMLELLTIDVQRIAVDGDTITKETNSKQELLTVITEYFESCSTCKLRLADITSTGSKVSAVEIESFQTRNGLQEERRVSLYDFSGSLINRLYYFPPEK